MVRWRVLQEWQHRSRGEHLIPGTAMTSTNGGEPSEAEAMCHVLGAAGVRAGRQAIWTFYHS
nr:hypothetical protein [Candidatus Sigynarchaeota archaeon]